MPRPPRRGIRLRGAGADADADADTLAQGLYKLYALVYSNGMTTTTAATLYAQPWWTRNDVTYLVVYYARTIARIARAYRNA